MTIEQNDILAELDHDLEPRCETSSHVGAVRPPATHAARLTACGHHDLICGPCAEAMRERAVACRNPYVRCHVCGDVRVGNIEEMMTIAPLPGAH